MPNPGNLQGNRRATRHGLRAGKLPKGCSYIQKACNELRRVLEDSVIACRSEVNVGDAMLIQTCLRWERHALLAQRWLREQSDAMNADQRLNYSREIARASKERDKALASLRIDASSGQSEDERSLSAAHEIIDA